MHLIILNVRPAKLVHSYGLVWGKYDGPIRNISNALASRVGHRLHRRHGDAILCASAMTYGEPSIGTVIDQLEAEGCNDFLFIPLYPQYAGATTGAVLDAISRTFSARGIPDFEFIANYYNHPTYLHALTKSVEPYHDYIESGARVVFSFHGIPMSQVKRGDPYPSHCRQTAEGVAHQLGLDDDQWLMTYQSKFGPARWLAPATIDTMAQLPPRGVRRVLVVCPGFATDCLETIEEIKVQNKEVFMAAGGEEFRYVRALNASADHVEVMCELVDDRLEPVYSAEASSTSTSGSS